MPERYIRKILHNVTDKVKIGRHNLAMERRTVEQNVPRVLEEQRAHTCVDGRRKPNVVSHQYDSVMSNKLTPFCHHDYSMTTRLLSLSLSPSLCTHAHVRTRAHTQR